MLPRGGTILAAVSGGADSMCLLHVLSDLAAERGFSVQAVHFNHMLRGDESDRDERFVIEQCDKIGIVCHIDRGDVSGYAREHGIGTEEAGRKLRYDFFLETAKNIGACRIATAHNGDDNCETVIMNMLRGTGINGLCGIPPVRGMRVRPLLTVTRAEIEKYLIENHIPHVEDSTNDEDAYTRNRIRHHVIPALKEINPDLCGSVADMIRLLSDDRDYLDNQAAKIIDDRVTVTKLKELPNAIASRVLRSLAPVTLSQKQTEMGLALIRNGEASGNVDFPKCRLVKEYDILRFETVSDSPASFEPFQLFDGFDREIPDLGLRFQCKMQICDRIIHKSFNSYLFKTEGLCGTITVRPRKVGDRLTIHGRGVTKSIKKLMIEERVPPSRRELIPVFSDDEGVIGVLGMGQEPRTVPDIGDTALLITVENIKTD